MYKLSLADKVSLLLVIVGAINLGLVGLFSFNLFNLVFGAITLLERLMYIIVGLSGINIILFIRKSRGIN